MIGKIFKFRHHSKDIYLKCIYMYSPSALYGKVIKSDHIHYNIGDIFTIYILVFLTEISKEQFNKIKVFE